MLKAIRALLVVVLALAATWAVLPAQAAAPNYPEVMFILDASGSMWGDAGGQKKIDVAKQVLAQAVPALPPEVRVGLVAYGHRRKGDCTDVETLVPAGSTDRKALLAKVQALSPKGKTPIAASVKQVAEALKGKENETTIVLVSDGIETCHDDPCGVIKALKQSGIKFVLHVVGFGVDARGKEQLSCLARAGGGKYFSAGDAKGLLAALEAVKKDVAVKVEKAKTTKVARKSRLGKLKLVVPQSTVRSLQVLKILKPDGKLVKEATRLKAESVHPLLAGKYKVVLGFANPNYVPPTEVTLGEYEVKGGETTEIKLGGIVFNLAKGLGDAARWVGVLDEGSEQYFVRLGYHNNGYYLWKPKAVPAGTYSITVTYARSKTPWTLAKGVKVEAGKETVVTLDTGFALKEAPGVQAWELLPAGKSTPVLVVRRRWDNDYPLWATFPMQPGKYDLRVYLKGMKEPLPVGEGIEIKKGQTVVFDAGL